MKNKSILLIGSIPPPIGGVTIHVSRLIAHLNSAKINFSFFNIKNEKLHRIFKYMLQANIIHLHSSNPYFRFLTSIICICYRKKLISTIHGNLGRFSKLGNFFDELSIRFTYYPIVINQESFEKSIKLNHRTLKISSFIPPLNTQELPYSIQNNISNLQKKHSYILATNASHLSYDSNQQEIYGIFFLIEFFKTQKELALIISDPSSEYITYLKSKKVQIPDNILFISMKHDFYEVIKLTDGIIRATTTDGDSISIKEALYLNKKVICTDVVDRPIGVSLFHVNDANSLQKNITKTFFTKNNTISKPFMENAFHDLLKLYNS